MQYTASFTTSLNNVNKSDWVKLIGDDNPFLEYEFLHAFEVSSSVGKDSGWLPHYIFAHDIHGNLVGVLPLYLKYNSLGEYIFDWQWVGLFKYYNIDYFPKFVIAIPYTPATGSRILIDKKVDYNDVFSVMIDFLFVLAKEKKVHSIHWLFTTKNECKLLESKGFIPRYTYQFHWRNDNYTNFDDFLSRFSAKKRNQVKRERRINENIEIEIIAGDDLKAKHWEAMYQFYTATIDKKWAYPYLTKEFFECLQKSFSKFTVMILARDKNDYIAGSLNFQKNKNMYGRYWGAKEKYRNLHFEMCYYQSIDYCIEKKIQLYEAGAQGEYKIKRGYLPSCTYSAHWIQHPVLSEVINKFIVESNDNLSFEIEELAKFSPYKKKQKIDFFS